MMRASLNYIYSLVRYLWRQIAKSRDLVIDLLFLSTASGMLLYYAVPPIRMYNIFFLLCFDYGILFNSSEMLSRFRAPLITTRGVHTFADDQDYLQALFAPLHWLPQGHYFQLYLHTLAIFSGGIFCYFFFRREAIIRLLIPAFFWLSPLIINMDTDLYHPEAYATIFLLLLFGAAYTGRVVWFYLWAFLALMSKEDVAVTVGCFAFLACFCTARFKLKRAHFVTCFFASLAVFFFNQKIALPYFKNETCAWLSTSFSATNLENGHLSPWFGGVEKNLLHLSFYWDKFIRKEVLFYLAVLLWPTIFFVRKTFPICLVPLAGAFINILGGGYLIQAQFHYDHSTFAAVVITVLLGLTMTAWKRSVSYLLFLGALLSNLYLPNVHPRISEFRDDGFWELDKVERTRFVEYLDSVLPKDIVISADHTSINYLLKGRDYVYMYENPFRGHYFGIYGACDGQAALLDRVPKADFVFIVPWYEIPSSGWFDLQRDYDHYKVYLWDEVYYFSIYVRRDSAYYNKLSQIVANLARHWRVTPWETARIPEPPLCRDSNSDWFDALASL